MPAVMVSTYEEFSAFISHAVETDEPLDQKRKNLDDLAEEVRDDLNISEDERALLSRELCEGLSAVEEPLE